ncbi:MAG: FHA domain-containing protein [Dehalococcoidia bacterium]
MNPFAHFERLAERIFEQDLPRALGGRLDPLELTRAIDRALDDIPRGAPPPTRLRLDVGAAAATALAGVLAATEIELGRYAGARLRERWPDAGPDPRVQIAVAGNLAGRDVRAILDEGRSDAGQTASLVLPAARPAGAAAGVVHTGDRAIPIVHLPLAIGRALDNDVVLDDVSVSRYHAQIRANGSGLVVVDLRSTNGTFVNGRRVHGEARIRPGDAVLVGSAALRLQAAR